MLFNVYLKSHTILSTYPVYAAVSYHANDFRVDALVLARSYQGAGCDVCATPELLSRGKKDGESRGGKDPTAI